MAILWRTRSHIFFKKILLSNLMVWSITDEVIPETRRAHQIWYLRFTSIKLHYRHCKIQRFIISDVTVVLQMLLPFSIIDLTLKLCFNPPLSAMFSPNVFIPLTWQKCNVKIVAQPYDSISNYTFLFLKVHNTIILSPDCNKSNTTSVISVAASSNQPGAPEFTNSLFVLLNL